MKIIKREWTTAQQRAINSLGGTVLVSAGAGSGKTAVLVERVIKRVTDISNPCNIENLLIVTFTKASAKEMRDRIERTLLNLIEERPEDNNIRRQYVMLNNCKISTIHSFCSNLLKEYSYVLNVPRDFKIADDIELVALKEDALNDVLEFMYKKNEEEFCRLSENLNNDRDDKELARAILEVYDFVISDPFFEEWFEDKFNLYKDYGKFMDNKFVKEVITFAREKIGLTINITEQNLKRLKEDVYLEEAYSESIYEDLKKLKVLFDSLDKDSFDDIKYLIDKFEMSRLKAIRGYKEDSLKEKIQESRNYVKKIMTELKSIFIVTEDESVEDFVQTYDIFRALFKVVKLFSEKFKEKKREARVLDFSDLEQLTLKLLLNKEGRLYTKTPIAEELSNKFREIMIDEYQDTNKTQELIFQSLAGEENSLFMVGDVKQSIYGFRQAKPEIFLKKKKEFEMYKEDATMYPCKVDLCENFRSRSEIINTINYVFSMLMTKSVGGIDYKESEQLKFLQKEKLVTPRVDVAVIEIDKDEEMDIVESRYVANLIHQMINDGFEVGDKGKKRKCEYKDFCVLLRSTKEHANTFSRELNKLGIPCWSNSKEEFFSKYEISVIWSFLRIIDNPLQDIFILSVLMSPIYMFTPDEISELRLVSEKESVYILLNMQAEKEGILSEKCKRFINDLRFFTMLSATVTINKLVQKIYDRTNYELIVRGMKNGKLRAKNLKIFLEYAREYENVYHRGLSGFITMLEKSQNKNLELMRTDNISETSNLVKIISIHASKGLEFPICIIGNCSRKFNQTSNNMLLNDSLGLGVKLKDKSLIQQYDTLIRKAINIANRKEEINEEMRILYVGMTRVREKLILLNTFKVVKKSIMEMCHGLDENSKIAPSLVGYSKSFSDWILRCVLKHKNGKELRDLVQLEENVVVESSCNINVKLLKSEDIPDIDLQSTDKATLNSTDILKDTNIEETITKVLNYEYKYKTIENIPAKVSVSELALKDNKKEHALEVIPAFLDKQGITAAQRGTIIHTVMQNVNFDLASQNIEKAINDLLESDILSLEQKDVIDLGLLRSFFNSEIFKRILNSQELYREYRFTTYIGARELDGNLGKDFEEEKIVLQGSVDCVFIEDGELVILDYKTDRTKNLLDLKNKYQKQLELYSKALEKCFHKRVKQCVIYSFYLKKFIDILY